MFCEREGITLGGKAFEALIGPGNVRLEEGTSACDRCEGGYGTLTHQDSSVNPLLRDLFVPRASPMFEKLTGQTTN